MTLSRRKTIALMGGGFIAAAAVVTGYSVTRMPHQAVAPWKAVGGYDDVRMNALSWAVLAPNPHNRQPWKVDLSEPDVARLYVDPNRLLPHTDPFSRQIVIGLGCFIELCTMAAAQQGVGVETVLFPEGSDPQRLDDRPVAVMTFKAGAASPDPLFEHVPRRRTLKEPFDTTRLVANDVMERIVGAARSTQVSATTEPDQVQFLRELSHKALEIEIVTPHTFKESVDLFRIGHREVNANPDGIDFSGPMFETLHLTGLFNREVVLDTTSMSYAQGLMAVLENADTAMAHIWQVTALNDREAQIAAGRDWLRLNLAATAEGVGIQPLSQALQEYPEMDELYQDIHTRLAPGGGTVQMFARLGYGPEVGASPRWPLEAKLTGA